MVSNLRACILFLAFLFFSSFFSFAEEEVPRITDKEIIERLTRLEEGQRSLEKRLDDLRDDINKRFEQIDKRFEQIDKRVEQVDSRISDLRTDMNTRFGEVMTFLQILTGIYLATMGGVFGILLLMWRRLSRVEARIEEMTKREEEISFLRTQFLRLQEKMEKVWEKLFPPGGVV